MEKDKELKIRGELGAEIAEKLPSFHSLIKLAKERPEKEALFHQDAFAADYQDEEYTLLGKVIKYAGMYGVSVRIHGTNRETLKD